MTDRVHSLQVVLERDMREDDVQSLAEAIRVSFEAQRAIDKELSEAGDSLNTVGFKVGFSIGVNPGTPVQ